MQRDRSDALPLTSAVAAVIGGACCAGLSAIGAVVGGLAVAAALGVTGGVLLGVAMISVVVLDLRSRGRRRSDPANGRPVR